LNHTFAAGSFATTIGSQKNAVVNECFQQGLAGACFDLSAVRQYPNQWFSVLHDTTLMCRGSMPASQFSKTRAIFSDKKKHPHSLQISEEGSAEKRYRKLLRSGQAFIQPLASSIFQTPML
jgi:hypothetical protein